MIGITLLEKLLNRIALYDDAIAYKELFSIYHSKLIRFSSLITKSKEAAEEVVSDVFLKVWNNRSTLSRVENFHLYIYIITKNQSINCLTRLKRYKSFSIDDTDVELKSMYLNPEQLMITSEMHKRLHLAINALPPRCKLIFKLIREDGLKYKEVAQLLNLSQKTVENQMTIALRKIGESIQLEVSRTYLN